MGRTGRTKNHTSKHSLKLFLFLLGTMLSLCLLSFFGINAIAIEPADATEPPEPPSPTYTIKNWNSSRYIVRKEYYFYKEIEDINTKTRSSANKFVAYSGTKYKFKFTKMLTFKDTGEQYAYLSGKGWINIKALYLFTERSFKFACNVKLIDKNAYLYTQPPNYEDSKKLGLAINVLGSSFESTEKYITCLNGRYLKVKLDDGNLGYVHASAVDPVLTYLKGKNKKIEKAIAAGLKLMNKSKYTWGGGRTAASVKKKHFDCSSFVHYAFSKAGKKLGSRGSVTTRTLAKKGKKVTAKNLRRGDIIILKPKNPKIWPYWHVIIYLGDGFFLHDSSGSDSGGVDIDTLNDKYQTSGMSRIIRRVA